MAFQQGHALLVGVGADLPNTVADAEGVGKVLRDVSRCAFPDGQVEVLTGPKATRMEVMTALQRLAERTRHESTVVVYFSGHGYFVGEEKKKYYLMPYGYNLRNLADTAISDSEFAAALKNLRAQKLLVLLDCCHAGGIDGTKAPGLMLAKAPIPPEAERMLGDGRGRVAIASSTADEVSFTGNPYSAFTVALIEGLTGTGASRQDGYVRVADLAMYASRRVPELTRKRQHPVLRFEHADNFVVSYYAGGDVAPKAPLFAGAPQIDLGPEAEDQRQASRGFTIINKEIRGPVAQVQKVEGGIHFHMRNDDEDDQTPQKPPRG